MRCTRRPMTWKPPRPCLHPGCPALVADGNRCGDHQRDQRRREDSRRGSSAQRGYNAAWQRARKRYLRENPFCVDCERAGQVTAATIVDHIEPHRGDQELFWDEDNWQSLCKTHHDQKTGRGE